MTMLHNGLAKLAEESGELLQVIGKMFQYPSLQVDRRGTSRHPDGTMLRDRLEEELGDLLAAVGFVVKKLELDEARINARIRTKQALFHQWDSEG